MRGPKILKRVCSMLPSVFPLAVVLCAIQPAAAQISLQGGNPTLTITTGVAGGQPIAVVDASARVRYREQAVVSKITIQTICPGQRFSLKALAIAPDVGTPAPEASLTDGMLAVDFITSIPSGNRNRRADIQYTASATFAQGNSTELGDDVHTVVYTHIAQ